MPSMVGLIVHGTTKAAAYQRLPFLVQEKPRNSHDAKPSGRPIRNNCRRLDEELAPPGPTSTANLPA